MKSKERMVMIVSMALALTGFAGRAASAAMRVDPCTLLTPAQIDAVIAGSFAAGQAIGTTGCSWTATKQVGEKKPFVTVSLWPGSGWAKMQAPLPGVAKSSVSGIGEGAMLASVGGFTSLSVLKGSTVFIVKVYGIPGDEKQAAMEKTLAGDVLKKM
jgi:hypothetical protein